MIRQVKMEELVPIFREQLENDKKVQFTPAGMSMRPMLDDKADRVFVERASKENVKKWDVVLFESDNGAYIMHRVVRLDDDGFITRGDNNCYNDKKQSYDALIGRVYQYEHKGKMHGVTDTSYRFYVIVWMTCYLPRKIFRKIKQKIRKIMIK